MCVCACGFPKVQGEHKQGGWGLRTMAFYWSGMVAAVVQRGKGERRGRRNASSQQAGGHDIRVSNKQITDTYKYVGAYS